MNIKLIYDKDLKKVMLLSDEEQNELSFEQLLRVTNAVIDDDVELIVTTEGFDENPDVEQNYKDIFNDIISLKNDSEIKALKDEIENDNGDGVEELTTDELGT